MNQHKIPVTRPDRRQAWRAAAADVEATPAAATSTTCCARSTVRAHTKSLINIGDEKGVLLDAAVRPRRPVPGHSSSERYCGYGALRIARAQRRGHFTCAQWSWRRPAPRWPAGSTGARARGGPDRVRSRHLGDGRRTSCAGLHRPWIPTRETSTCSSSTDKSAYLADLLKRLDRGWLHRRIDRGGRQHRIRVPDYRNYMRAQQDSRWDTVEHKTHGEYQTLIRSGAESEYLGG